MIDGKDDMEVMNGQDPFLLVFEPLRFLEGPTLGTMSILSSLVMKLQRFADGAGLHHTTQCGRAAI